ncbi:hypothetical protein ACWQTE_000366 [Pseudomonas aeruginosa]
MLNQIATCRFLSALALLSMLLWAGHAFSGYGKIAQVGTISHQHSHDEDLSEQDFQLWGDHQHSSLMADHVHETPHLSAWLPTPQYLAAEQPLTAGPLRLPSGHSTRIERPPRF